MAQHEPSGRWIKSAAILGTLAGLSARHFLAKGWEAATDDPPPSNPVNEGVTWGEALTWAAVSGVTVGLVRVFAHRAVAGAWQESDQSADDAQWTRSEVLP